MDQKEASTALNASEKLLKATIDLVKDENLMPWIVMENKRLNCLGCKQLQHLPKVHKVKDVVKAIEKFVEGHEKCSSRYLNLQ